MISGLSRADRRNLLLVFALAIIIGLAGYLLFPRIPVISDSVSYFTVARNLLLGRGLVSSLAYSAPAYFLGVPVPDAHLPGWPLLLAGFMAITGVRPEAPIILNIILTVLSALLVYLLARAWSPEKRALVASVLFIFFPALLMYEFTGMGEIHLIFWGLFLAFLSSIAGEKRKIIWLLGIGLAYAMAYLTRQTAVLFLPLVLVILKERAYPMRHILVLGVLCLLFSGIAFYLHSEFALGDVIRFNFLFRYTGLSSGKDLFWDIIPREGFSVHVPVKDWFWIWIVRKPLRASLAIIRRNSLPMLLLHMYFVGILFLAPLGRWGRWMKFGLLGTALIVPALLWIYAPPTAFIRMSLAFAVVSGTFLVARARISSFVGKILVPLLVLFEMAIVIPAVMSVQNIRNIWQNYDKRVSPALQKIVSPGAKIVGIRSLWLCSYALWERDKFLVFYPRTLADARLMDEKLKPDAVIFTGRHDYGGDYGPADLDTLTWQARTLIVGQDTLVVALRKGR